MIRFLITLACLIWLPLSAIAQDKKGGLEGLLERSLSSDTLEVTVDGLSGALSSTATIERLTFADPNGPWMIIEDAKLDWTRTALLRGRIRANELAAARITLLRLPAAAPEDPELPSAEAEPFKFQLPELPVSVEIERIAAEEIVLEEAIFGEQVVAKLVGGLTLANGNGAIALDLERTDVDGTLLNLNASFENSSEELVVILDAKGREGGLLSRRTGIPGAPALELAVTGRGLLSDFEADVRFDTADSTRLGGIVRLLAAEAEGAEGVDRTIQAKLSGDIRPLVTEDIKGFFGPETGLDFETVLFANGAISVPRLHLQSSLFNMRTRLALSETKWPEQITLVARLAAAEGTPVRLPIPGTPTELTSAYVNVSYDRTAASTWSAVIAMSDLQQGAFEIESVDLRGAGELTLPEGETLGAVSGRLSGGADGVVLGDPKLQQAAGDEVAFNATFDWQKEAPLTISEAAIAAGDVELSLDGMFANLAEGVDFEGGIALSAPNLSRFAALTGQALQGAVDLDLSGTATLLSGMFDLEVSGQGRDLKTGIAEADNLLGGRADLAFSGARDTDGISIRQALIETEALNLSATGGGSNAQTDLDIALALDSLARIVPGFPGAAEFSGTVRSGAGGYTVDGSGSGPAGLRLNVGGSVAEDFATADLTLDGTVRMELAQPFLSPRTASGAIGFNVSVNGPFGLDAVTATLRVENGRVADPTVGFALEQLGGTIGLERSTTTLDLSGRGNRGGRISLGGSLGLTPPQQAALDIDIDRLRFALQGFLATRIDGAIALDGPLTGGAVLSGEINLAETEIRIPDGGGTVGTLEGVRHVGAPQGVERTLSHAGLAAQPEPASAGGAGGPVLGLDLFINSPTRIFVRGFGLDAELGGSVEISGTSANPRPVGEFELQRGRLDILGQRLDLTEGEILLTASIVPDIRFVASTETDDYEVAAIISGPADEPEISFESTPTLPEDEVLSRLLFDSEVSGLSPLQALQLANSLVAARNGTGLGFFNALREEAGLDDLDLTTEDDGQTNLRLGKYISDDVYTNVNINNEGETEIDLNVELTDSLTARGTAGTDNSSIGLFFERDY
ncbi:translocation/assembly module TamB domain-containing protein [Dinoroseobacter sp. S375]|uniref:translocation/assembly module TamB domain-containing protein n=1 Tax=Dinoroseobacter sp. S375 TaxID=3415136 RepID=UPI003C7AF1C3